MRVVLFSRLDLNLSAQAVGELGRETDLHGAAIGLFMAQSYLDTLAVLHRTLPP
jgi:hypothetical protein